jgi:hypothetical protein
MFEYPQKRSSPAKTDARMMHIHSTAIGKSLGFSQRNHPHLIRALKIEQDV